jgi:hypothetical protein
MVQLRFLLAAGFVLILQSSADAACVAFMNFHLTSEGPWSGHGTIKQGQTCSGSYSAGGTMTFKRLYLLQAPSHGTVRLREGGKYFYTAPVGYSGSDNFKLRICGTEGTIEGCTNLSYNMTVI